MLKGGRAWRSISFDIDRVVPMIRRILLAGKLDLSSAVKVDGDNMDETAVMFICPLLAAACICDTIREHDRRAGDHPCRVYLRRAVAWERLPAAALLSVVEDSGVTLNPEVFAPVRVYQEPVVEVKRVKVVSRSSTGHGRGVVNPSKRKITGIGMAEFDEEWRKLEGQCLCDGIGSSEHARVLAEWNDAGRPTPVIEFLRRGVLS